MEKTKVVLLATVMTMAATAVAFDRKEAQRILDEPDDRFYTTADHSKWVIMYVRTVGNCCISYQKDCLDFDDELPLISLSLIYL